MTALEYLAPFAIAVAVSVATTPIAARIATTRRRRSARRAQGESPQRHAAARRDRGRVGFFMGLAVALILTGNDHEYCGHLEGQILGSLILLTVG